MKINSILRYFILAGIFLVPFIALIVAQSMFFPFITGKNFLFRILIEILFGLYLVLAVRDANYRPKFSWLFGAFVVFLLIIGIADIFSENPFKSFWSNYERMEGYVTFLHLFAYFVVASALLNTEKLWERLFQTSLGVSVIMSLYGVLQYAGTLQIHQGSNRLDATLGNATYLAIYVLIHIFLALFLFFRERQHLWIRICYLIALSLNLFVLYQTQTRGAILGLIGGVLLITVILAIFERQDKRLRKFAIGGVAVVLVLAGLFFLIRNTSFVKNHPTLDRLASITLEGASANPRFMIWELAWQGFKERPILGWGQESFNYVFNKYYDPKLYGQEQWFDRTHNVIFDWLIAGGLLGLLGYLSLYLLALYYIWRKGEFTFKEKAVFTGMFAAYFFHNLFVFDNIVSLILFMTFLAYLHSHATRGKDPRFKQEAPQWLKLSALPSGILISVALIYFVNWTAYFANLTLIKALVAVQNPEQSLTYFKQTLAYNGFGNQETREQLMQFTVNLRSNTQIADSVKQEALILTSTEMQKMIAQSPNDARHFLFYGTVLDAYGQYPQAETALSRALQLSPKKQSILFQLGTHYLNSGNQQKALAVFKQAYDLAPEYNEARLIYAMGAIYAGNNALATELLGNQIVIDDRLLRAYADTKQWGKAIAIAQAKVNLNPNDPNTELFLAAIYYQAGQKQNAIAVIKAMIAANPQFKDQGEGYIKQIEAGK